MKSKRTKKANWKIQISDGYCTHKCEFFGRADVSIADIGEHLAIFMGCRAPIRWWLVDPLPSRPGG